MNDKNGRMEKSNKKQKTEDYYEPAKDELAKDEPAKEED
jgi:hypothetical protein